VCPWIEYALRERILSLHVPYGFLLVRYVL
jgi:hypothetical protein